MRTSIPKVTNGVMKVALNSFLTRGWLPPRSEDKSGVHTRRWSSTYAMRTLDLQTSMPIMSEPTRMAPPDLDVQKDEDEEVTSIPAIRSEHLFAPVDSEQRWQWR